MSSDNFWFTRDGKVYMGFASDIEGCCEKAEQVFYDKIVERGRTYFEGTPGEAADWAWREYSEYGHWGEH